MKLTTSHKKLKSYLCF